MTCPECNKPMINLGNITYMMIMSNPPCWYETHACLECKTKKTVLVRGAPLPPKPDVSGYKEVP